jgi:hypothetical protein
VARARFHLDESTSWQAALDIVEGRRFPALGPSISGTEASVPGPLFYYVMALPQALTRDPLAGGAFVAALGLGAAFALSEAVRRAWGERAGLLFLCCAALLPWPVVLGDRIWSANLLFPASAAALCCLLRLVERPSRPAAGLLAFLLVAGFQVHLTWLHLWVLTLAAVAVLRPRLPRAALAAGAAAGLLCYVPYLVLEARDGFRNTRRLLGPAPGTWPWSALPEQMADFLGLATTDVSYLVGQGYWSGFHRLAFWAEGGRAATTAFFYGAAALGWLAFASSWGLCLAGALLLARRGRRDAGSAGARALVLAFVTAPLAVVLVFALTRKAGYAHYVAALGPVALLAPTAALERLARSARGAWAAALCVAAVTGGSWLSLAGHYRVDGIHSLRVQKPAVDFVLARSGGRPFVLALPFPHGHAASYGALARRWRQAPWRAAPQADQAFTVLPSPGPLLPTRAGTVAEVLELDDPAVVHTRR